MLLCGLFIVHTEDEGHTFLCAQAHTNSPWCGRKLSNELFYFSCIKFHLSAEAVQINIPFNYISIGMMEHEH